MVCGNLDVEKMEAEIGSSDEYLLSDAFWAAMNMFDKLYVVANVILGINKTHSICFCMAL